MADAPLITVAIQFGHEASNLGKLDRFYGNLNSHGIVLINLMNYDTKTSRKLKNEAFHFTKLGQKWPLK